MENYIRGKFEIIERKIKLVRPFGFLGRLVERFPDFYEWRLALFVPAIEVRFKLKKLV
jgi:hypothetical protein